MKRLLRLLLSRMGYVPKNTMHLADCWLILDSFTVRKSTYGGSISLLRKEKTSDISFKTACNVPLFESSGDDKRDTACFHQYIYDRGVKAIIREHEEEQQRHDAELNNHYNLLKTGKV